MKYVQPIVFITLFILACKSTLDTVSPVVPGWHTTLYPPYYIIRTSIILLTLLLSVIGYIVLARNIARTNILLFISHLLLTIPIIVFHMYPFDYVSLTSLPIHEIEGKLDRIYLIEGLSFVVFVLGQLIFGIYYFHTFKK